MERFSYSKDFRLKSRSDYLRCKNGRNRLVFHRIIVSFVQNPFGHARVGCSVTKDKGHAFQRNLFRRRIKEAFRLHEGLRMLPYDIHFIPQKHVVQYEWKILQMLVQEVFLALKARGLLYLES